MKSFDRLPAAFQCDAVRPYYDKLCKKTASRVVKRIFDIAVALVMLVFLILPILVIAVLVKATSPGHVFFRQERVTTYGRRFRIFKFRTMVENAEALGTQ
ncbi:MAG: sugar transferase, partial [Ruminococcus sp.]|nr:sugar transferase [Ruminococcus sp.]